MTDSAAYPSCKHGRKIYERCEQCEADMRAGKHGGFERASETSNERNASLNELRRVLSAWPDDAAVFRPGIDWNVSDSATRPSLTAGDLRSVLDELERLRKVVAQIGPDRLTAYEEDAGHERFRISDDRLDDLMDMLTWPAPIQRDREDAIEALRELKSRRGTRETCCEWTPVGSAMPERFRRCLVAFKSELAPHSGLHVCQDTIEWDGSAWMVGAGHAYTAAVTHWRYLPEAPSSALKTNRDKTGSHT